MEGETPQTEANWLDMMEKAKALASLLSTEDSPAANMDMERMLQMMAILQQHSATAHTEAEPPTEPAYIDTSYDACVQNPSLRALKAAIPHMAPNHRHSLSIAVKCMEIKLLHAHYTQTNILTQSAPHPNWRQDMLAAMQPHLPREQRQSLTLMATMLQMMNILTEIRQDREGIII